MKAETWIFRRRDGYFICNGKPFPGHHCVSINGSNAAKINTRIAQGLCRRTLLHDEAMRIDATPRESFILT